MTRVFDTPLYPYARSADQDAVTPPRHPVVVVGAGPVGLAAAIDLAQHGVRVVVVDDNDRVSHGSRAICFSKRTLEILDRLGCGAEATDHGVTWNSGRVYRDTAEIYGFNLLPEDGHRRPAFVNLQQYHLERMLVERALALQAEGRLELRGGHRVVAVGAHPDHARVEIDTPEGPYSLEAEWLVACDGAGSPVRRMMGLDFVGRVFEDNFLIADVEMQADFPSERWFWFDPPFNRGQSALLHRQPDNIWRIDLQLGRDIDRETEQDPERVMQRIRQMLGPEADFELEWVSIYTFQCRRMERFRHGRVLFAGDAAHQVSPFGARGANSGLQDADNLAWKLALVLQDRAPEALIDSYNFERVCAADENILNSTRSTDFITPKSEVSRIYRDAVLDLAASQEFARPMVNSGRLSVPCVYDDSPLNGPEASPLPPRTRPGAPLVDLPLPDLTAGAEWLSAQTGGRFVVLAMGLEEVPERVTADGLEAEVLQLDPSTPHLAERYLGHGDSAVYLLRPDQHVAARWTDWQPGAIADALLRAAGRITGA